VSGQHRTETVVIGAGQAGLALSWHLSRAGRPHVVLERGRIGERWRSERWDSLTLLTPAWASLLPGQDSHPDPSAFLGRDTFVDELEQYAWSFLAPVVEGATVVSVRRHEDGYHVATDRDSWLARNVVVATGDCGVPLMPAQAAGVPQGVASLHAVRFRAPESLPPGAVLVVGSGPTGQQLALDLARSGREVTLAVGRHARLPRRYRGRDIWEWLDRLGDFDVSIDEVADPTAARRTPSVAVTGAKGGEPLDLQVLHEAGVDVRGRLLVFAGSHAVFSDGLAAEVERAEVRMRRILARVDELADREGHEVGPEHVREIDLPESARTLDLRDTGVGTVLWATGYRRAYPWLHVPVLDADGEIVQHHGVTDAPGLYTLGLRFQRRRGSHLIGGVGADAELLAAKIAAGDGARAQGLAA
jgi:putative flavoprotein involved in K+ transport